MGELNFNFSIDYTVTGYTETGVQIGKHFNITEKEEFQEFLEFSKFKLIDISKAVLREELGKGFDKNYITVVDGKRGLKEEDVNPLGKIEYLTKIENIGELLSTIYTNIENRSKVVSGLYMESNWVFVNGGLVARSRGELDLWIKKLATTPFDLSVPIQFVNVMPYAGRLERMGVSAQRSKMKTKVSRDRQKRSGHSIGGKQMVLSPNGAYFLAAKAIKSKFKQVQKVEFQWVNGSRIDLSQVPKNTKSGKPLRKEFSPGSKYQTKKGNKGSYVYPTVTVYIGKEAIK